MKEILSSTDAVPETIGTLFGQQQTLPLLEREAERRRHPRLDYARHIKMIAGTGFDKHQVSAKAFDISSTGLCLEVRDGHFFEIGTKLRVKLVPTHHMVGLVPILKNRLVNATVARLHRLDGDTWIYGLRFDDVLADVRTVRIRSLKKVASALLVLIGITAIVTLKVNDLRWFWYAPLYRLYGILGGCFFVSRALFSICYREPKDKGYLPTVSVIISVKNEEQYIAETVKRVFDVRYPLSKFELIVIDDGSTDNTWQALEKVKPEYARLRLFRFPTNLGKRHGMALGAREASGEILVYVDSDSYVEPEGIYKLVQPFFDKNVGAVAGHTRVIVQADNAISKMESVRYFISHQFFKTAESIFGAVTCCPGAFSAYRREAVLRVLPQWLNQRFLGVKATFGDDRSLTNFVLRTHQVVYHSGAICVTYVPTSWKQFFTQQLRWKKSWARETTVASRILIKKHPLAALSYYLGIVVTLLSPLMFLRAVVIGPVFLSQSCAPYFLGVFLVYLFLCLFFLFQTGESHWPYGMLFAVMYLVILCWQTYWAIFSINKTKWGTR